MLIFGISQPRAAAISSSVFPLATAYSTRALVIAALSPDFMISGVNSMSSLLAISLTMSSFGFGLNALPILLRDSYAVINPPSYFYSESGSYCARAKALSLFLASASTLAVAFSISALTLDMRFLASVT